jgi:hypothetical protein
VAIGILNGPRGDEIAADARRGAGISLKLGVGDRLAVKREDNRHERPLPGNADLSSGELGCRSNTCQLLKTLQPMVVRRIRKRGKNKGIC